MAWRTISSGSRGSAAGRGSNSGDQYTTGMPLRHTRPDAYTIGVYYRQPVRFAADYPDHAGVARELLRLRPDVRELRFNCAWVFARRDVPLDSVDVQLESATRTVHVRIWPVSCGLIADVVREYDHTQPPMPTVGLKPCARTCGPVCGHSSRSVCSRVGTSRRPC